MKRSTIIAITICLSALITTTGFAQPVQSNERAGTVNSASGQPENKTTAALQQLAEEVKKLKVEVLKLQLELQRGKIAQSEQELQQAQAAKRQILRRESEINQEIAELDRALSQSTLAPEERTELETAKANLMANSPIRLQTEQQAISQQEAEAVQRLELEQQRWQELIERGKRLGIAEDKLEKERPATVSRPARRH